MLPPRAAILAAVLVGAAGCRPAGSPPLVNSPPADPGWFEDATERVGLDFVHDPGPTDGAHFMPQIMGSGAALFDFDGDGRLDVLLLQNAGPDSPSKNKLFQQLPDGRFQDVSAGSGLDFAGWNMGVAVGDVNNDGRPDVLITQYGGVKLFLNEGGGKFRDVTKEAGLDGRDGAPPPPFSTTTATAGSTSSSPATSITTPPRPAPGRVGRRTTATRPRSAAWPACCSTT